MIAALLAGSVMAAAFIPWAIRNDRADLHLAHRPGSGCPECH